MKLTRLRLRNVRNLRDGDYAFAYPDGRPFDVALVTGPSAGGKTTLREVIAMAKERVASYGRPAKPREFLRRGEANGLVELTLVLDDSERARVGIVEPIAKVSVQLSGALDDHDARLVKLLATYRHDPAFGVVDYFPANRRLSTIIGAEPPPDEAAEGRMRLGKDGDKYRAVWPWLRDALVADATAVATRLRDAGLVLGASAPDKLAAFRAMLASMCPWLRLVGLAVDGATPMFARKDGSAPASFQLSDAEQDAVLLAASWQRVGLSHSLVLIDRLDLHAHPDDQWRWLQALVGAGQASQIIVATSSERLLREVPAAQHVKIGG